VTQPVPQPDPAQRPQRPAELEDWLNARLYHPLSWRLAQRLAPTPITPDMVSVAGAGAIVLAAFAYEQPAVITFNVENYFFRRFINSYLAFQRYSLQNTIQ